MSAEFWAILGVGAAGLGFGVTMLGLGWRVYHRLDTRLDMLRDDVTRRFGDLDRRFNDLDRRISDLDRRLARVEGWIEGRFRDGAVQGGA